MGYGKTSSDLVANCSCSVSEIIKRDAGVTSFFSWNWRRDVIFRMLGKRVNGSIRPWIQPRILWISYIVYIRIDVKILGPGLIRPSSVQPVFQGGRISTFRRYSRSCPTSFGKKKKGNFSFLCKQMDIFLLNIVHCLIERLPHCWHFFLFFFGLI